MQKIDRRVRRTRRRLRDALIALVLEQGYDNITIQEITDRADLSRATFYLHYKDKDELLASSLEEMFDELVESTSELIFKPEYEEGDKPPPSLLAFQHVAEYADLYRSLLGDKGVTSVIYRTLKYLARIYEKQLTVLVDEQGIDDIAIPTHVAAQNLAGSLFAILSWWLEEEMPYSPDEIAQMYHDMTAATIRAALGTLHQTPTLE